jgi:hypothetical protein
MGILERVREKVVAGEPLNMQEYCELVMLYELTEDRNRQGVLADSTAT